MHGAHVQPYGMHVSQACLCEHSLIDVNITQLRCLASNSHLDNKLDAMTHHAPCDTLSRRIL